MPNGAGPVFHRLRGAFGIDPLIDRRCGGFAFIASRWLGVQEIAVGLERVTGIPRHFDDVCAVGIGRPREERLEGPVIVIVLSQDFGGTFEEDPDVGILERRGNKADQQKTTLA